MSQMPKYFKINRIEYTVTRQCTGKCKHCSIGSQLNNQTGKCVQAQAAVDALVTLSESFPVESVMTFGGEPLLYADTVCAIHNAARENGIAKRQLITNGYFSKDDEMVKEMAKKLIQSGVNAILLSVDTFHQETIPLEQVRLFAEEIARSHPERIRLHPAWVVSEQEDNPYNEKTREILSSFSDLGIGVSSGNDIFPAGNAAVYLKEYYPMPEDLDLTVKCGEAKYTENLADVRTICMEPEGNVKVCAFTIGNLYQEKMADILSKYDPYQNDYMKALMKGGVKQLVEHLNRQGEQIDTSDCYSACSICRKIVERYNNE